MYDAYMMVDEMRKFGFKAELCDYNRLLDCLCSGKSKLVVR